MKYYSLTNYLLDIDKCNENNSLWRPYILLLIYNIIPVIIGSTLVTYVEVKTNKINLSIFVIKFYLINLKFF